MSTEEDARQRLWAPWRMAYIATAKDGKPGGCIFCEKPESDDDAANLIVHRGQRCFAVLNAFPYNNGHLMVAPYRHTGDLTDLSAEDCLELWELTQQAVAALDKALQPQGYNVGLNLGRVAGAGIADHLHLHVVPRWQGDTNFMSVLADMRVISQSLQEAYRLLRAAWPE